MNRHELTHRQWERLQPLLPPQKPHTGRPAAEYRRILNGILWLLRTGAPWRDLPERYGPWGTVASRFYRWRKAGIWARLFAAVQQRADAAEQLDWDLHSVDGTIVRAHQHAAGAHTGNAEAEALGRSPGGFSTRAFNMCGDVAAPNLYAVSQQNCLQALDMRMTIMGQRSGSSSSN